MTTRKINGGECSTSHKTRKVDPATREEPRSLKPLVQSHLDVLNHGKFSDVTFIVGESKERIPCHQLFLKIRSPFFEVMFSERWNQDNEVTLEDVDPEIFRQFLKFIYTDALEADVSEALKLLQLAHMYDVQLLVGKCEKLLEYKVKLEDSIAVFQTARQYEKIQLMDKIGDMWAESLSKIQSLPIFTQLDKETLMYILKRDDLKMKEVDIFRLALQWAGNQTDATLKESLQDILPLIRFPTMTVNEFTTAVVPTKTLPMHAVVELFTYFGTDDAAAKKSMANELGLSTRERQPKDPTVYVALYDGLPTDGAKSLSSRRRKFQYLKECLVFNKGNQFNNDSLQAIGLNCISLYSPLKAASTLQSAGVSAYFRAFKICLNLQRCPDKCWGSCSSNCYTELQSLSGVLVEEGKTTDIKLNTVAPLEEGRAYCITVEEEPGNVSVPGYYGQRFRNRMLTDVAVTVRNVGPTLLNCHKNRLEGFKHDHDSDDKYQPGLIHRLGFQEL